MKKLFLTTFLLLFLTSCLWSLEKIKKTEEDLFIETDNKVFSETSDVLDESYTWVLDDSSIEEEELNNQLNLNEESKVISIEEQYCKSKWWKVDIIDNKKICFATDDIGLLKCEIGIYYLDKCRDKTAIIEKWIIVSLPNVKKVVKSNETVIISELKNDNNLEKQDIETKIEDQKTKNLWNWFLFKEDNNNKYLYLQDKLITKLDKTWKLLMSTNSGNIFAFNIYSNMTDPEPIKIINVDISNKSFTESIIKVVVPEKTNSWVTEDILKDTNNWDNNVDSSLESISKQKSWKSWIYYINDWKLWLENSDWEKKSLFWDNSVDIYNYELMLNKQVKIFYYVWEDKKQEEKIIDISGFLINN